MIWPSKLSSLENELGVRQAISYIRYLARLPKDNPNYITNEQDQENYPREHLPYCRMGSLDVGGGGVIRKGEPVAAHFHGTSPSLVWLGSYLLNLGLEDNNAKLAYLYNMNPSESLCYGSAELRITICDPSDGPKFFPSFEN